MEPLEIHVRLTPSDEVFELRQQVTELNSKLQDLQRRFNKLEYDRHIEYIYNSQLCDLLREHKIPFPRSQDLSNVSLFDDLR